MRKCKSKFENQIQNRKQNQIQNHLLQSRESRYEFEFEFESLCKLRWRHGNCLNYEFLTVCVYGNFGNYAKRCWLTHTHAYKHTPYMHHTRTHNTPHLCSNTLCVGACAAIVCLFCVSYNMLIATVCMFAYWIIASMCGRFGPFVCGWSIGSIMEKLADTSNCQQIKQRRHCCATFNISYSMIWRKGSTFRRWRVDDTQMMTMMLMVMVMVRMRMRMMVMMMTTQWGAPATQRNWKRASRAAF